MKNIIDEIFNQKFVQSFLDYTSLDLEEFNINNDYFFTRVIFSNKYTKSNYSVETKIEDVTTKKHVVLIRDYIKRTEDNTYDSTKLIDLFRDKISEKHKAKIIELASHNSKPLWYIKRDLGVSAKVFLIYHEDNQKYIDTICEDCVLDESKLINNSEAVSNELGIELNNVPFLKDGLVFILPHEDASIINWKIFKEDQRWEGLKCKLNFKRYLYPFPNFKLECRLYDKNNEKFYSKIVNINNEDQLILKFLPLKDDAREIYRVETMLYEYEQLIDECSGYPMRQIKVDVKLMGGDGNESN